MAKTRGLAEAFASYAGAKGKNPRWSWSARTPDGKTVVMTFWKHQFDYKTKPISYAAINETGSDAWLRRPGNSERLENLIYSQDHCDGLLRVVITVAEDVNADPPKIADCFPQPKMQMRITDLKRTTGEWRAELVEGPDA
jgi:hypothetical protein